MTSRQRLTELWQYRELLRNMVRRDVKLKYRGSVLGFLWSLVHPLAFLGIYSFVFMVIMPVRHIESFPLYFMSGYLPWSAFVLTVTTSATCLVDNGGLIKKIFFPREILPLSVGCSFLVNFLLTLAALLPVFWLSGHWPGLSYLWLPLLLVAQTALTLGVGLLVSISYVLYRDLQYLLELFLTLLFWLTPIVYTPEMVPESFRPVFLINPMSHVVGCYRSVLLYGTMPEPLSLLYLCVLGVVLAAASLWRFWRQSGTLAEMV